MHALTAIPPGALAWGNPTMLIRLFWLLILVPPLVVAAIVTAILAWTMANMARRGLSDRRSRWRQDKARLQPDGTPWPIHQRGLCDVCWAVGERVYHLDDDRRICHDCYVRAGCDRGAPPPSSRPGSRTALEI
jgi:hypothetical protein